MSLSARLESLHRNGQQGLLRGGLKGLEREALRLSGQGEIARTPHPSALGSALTHPWITTDFSEALIELITPPSASAADTLAMLSDIHSFVCQHLDDERLLATSMPIGISGDESIPLARFGRSNIGMMKHIYRRGLAWRYGSTMQAIAGVHFNYSVNEALWPVLQDLEQNRGSLQNFIDSAYFGVIRNMHRHGWLLIYLFGHSPALCKSFFHGREALADRFATLDRETLYRPNATSLRMSDIGYKNDTQTDLHISLNHVDEYIAGLEAATTHPFAPYAAIGVKVNGEYRQLNANILQIENEYYSSIRPKQVAMSGEKPTQALKKRGVRYLEVRSLDLNCFEPTGIALDQMLFLEAFLLLCLCMDSPPLTVDEATECSHNSLSVACCARGNDFRLLKGGQPVSIREWATPLLNPLLEIASILDEGDAGQAYRRCILRYFEAVGNPELTPSATILQALDSGGVSFAGFAMDLTRVHSDYWRQRGISREKSDEFVKAAENSWVRQAEIESSDTLDFDDFLQRYFDQT